MLISDGGGGSRRIPKSTPHPKHAKHHKGSAKSESGGARTVQIRAGTSPGNGNPGGTIDMNKKTKVRIEPAVYRTGFDKPKKGTINC